jgi:hypothetical protein
LNTREILFAILHKRISFSVEVGRGRRKRRKDRRWKIEEGMKAKGWKDEGWKGEG